MNDHPQQSRDERRHIQVSLELEHLKPGPARWQFQVYEVIFGIDTWAGKAFDIGLLMAILLSIMAVMLDSVPEIQQRYGDELLVVEWTLTVLFTLEYVLRLASLQRPLKYGLSFLGLIDLLAILPSYINLLIDGTRFLSVIRAIRLLRVFRILKLVHYLKEVTHLWAAIQATRRKIMVFLLVILTVVLIMGSTMYLIEGPEHGFTSIPQSVYWAIVTMTTVGYGDIAPQTVLGKMLASLAMILGYSMIIVPTGVFTVEIVNSQNAENLTSSMLNQLVCPNCELALHQDDANYCRHCGTALQKRQAG